MKLPLILWSRVPASILEVLNGKSEGMDSRSLKDFGNRKFHIKFIADSINAHGSKH